MTILAHCRAKGTSIIVDDEGLGSGSVGLS